MNVISSSIEVLSGVTSTGFEVVQDGVLRILNGGWANEVTASSGGAAVVSSGGILYVCHVGNGGTVTVTSSGYARDVTVEYGGLYVVSSGGSTVRSLVQSGGTQIAYAGVKVLSAVVENGGRLSIQSGALARTPVISQGGMMEQVGGGLSDQTKIYGILEVHASANTDSATVFDGGKLAVLTGGHAYKPVVSSGGTTDVASGGVVNSALVYEDGIVIVSAGGSSFNTKIDGGTMVLEGKIVPPETEGGNTQTIPGAYASDTTVNPNGGLIVSYGAVAVIIRENGGYVRFEEGSDVGFASNAFSGIALNGDGASATVHSGTTATGTTVGNGGRLEIFEGGSAMDTSVGSGGLLEVKSGGVATDVVWTPCVGSVTSAEGALVMFASTYAGVYYGSADELVSRAPVLESQTVGARDIMYVFSGGTACDLLAQSGGRVFVSGGVLTGSVTVENGAEVSAGEGAELNFDLRRASAGTGALVNDLAAIRGTLLYTLTVNGELKPGKYDYSLADGAGDFDGAITVRTAAGEILGNLEIGEKTVLDGVEYLLILAASNLSLAVDVPDVIPPTVSDIRITPETPTDQDVVVTAVFGDDSGTAYGLYRLEGVDEWSDYLDGVAVTRNTTVYLKAVDTSGLESAVSEVAVTNIDRDAPVITLDADVLTPARRTTLTADTEKGAELYYSRDGNTWTLYTGPVEVTENGAYSFAATDAAGNTGTAEIIFENIYPAAPQNPAGNEERVSWDPVGAERYILEYSTDHFAHGIRIAAAGAAVDMLDLPAGTWQWRVRADDSGEWAAGDDILSGGGSAEPEVLESRGDGIDDIFFASTNGIWGMERYFSMAQHVGSVNDWRGTNELVFIEGKGRIQNCFFGSADPNILCLTDGDNGEALFLDDVFTELPESIASHQARIANIDEIRAGAGGDVIDLTSWRFEYTGGGMIVRGGEGDDTIWANKGENYLFGDEGDDRIVGASGNDVIAGGAGNDRMHGGGGADVFTFCENFGMDTVEQLETGSVTLWFAAGNESHWDAGTMTYSDGENSVTVKGAASVGLKFGDDGSDRYDALASAGAFAEFTSQKIFEDSQKGMLAGSY